MNSFPLVIAAALALAYLHPMQTLGAGSSTAYIGTYTGEKSEGIYRVTFDSSSGKFGKPELAAKTPSPTFLALHPSKPLLYAVGESSSLGPRKEGAVSAFTIDPASGDLRLLNQETSGGSGPCHLAVDPTGKCVLVANYGSGSVAALPVDDSGRLGAAKSVIQHHGSSVNPQRQKGPHAHQIVPDPANRFALVCDLGLDQVLVYALDPTGAVLKQHDKLSVAPGAGPRHLAFHPQGRWVYLINEMGSTINSLRYSPPNGALETFQTISTLPADFKKESSCAEIAVHPNGNFVYGSNRGGDSIAVYRIDPASGTLTLVQHAPTGGRTPRHFAIHPSGNWFLAQNQDSDNVVLFAIDLASGKLSQTNESIEVGKPVCIVFYR